MTNSQLVRWARNEAVATVVRNAPETAAIPGWAAKLAAFDEAMDSLRAIAARQAEPVRSSVLRRDLQLAETVQFALKLSGVALSYARDRNLPLLASRVRLRPSSFMVVRPHQRVQLAQMVHDLLVPIVAELADQGVTPATLDAFQASIDTATAAASAPREAVAQRRAATEQLREGFRRVDEMIQDHFDAILLPLKQTHPEFYLRYKAARMLIDHPGRGAGGAEAAAPAATPATSATPASVTPPTVHPLAA